MYIPPACRTDAETALAFAGERGFGLAVAWGESGPAASAVPFLITREEGVACLEFHVALANPLAALAAQGGTWLMCVQRHDAYVSPDWYASRDQVPTWLYEFVQITGKARPMPQQRLPAHLEALSAKFESLLAPKAAWTMDKVPVSRLEKLLNAIAGIELTIDGAAGSFKLNQNKSDADCAATARALSQQDDPAARALSARIAALRPQLSYA
jgi:transcriptional regulator